MGDGADERRRFPRLDKKIRVEIDYHKPGVNYSTKGEGTSKDIALGGVAFFHEADIELESYVVIYCHLPEAKQPTAFFGRVVRCNVLDDGRFIVSVKFLRYEKHDMELLKKYLSPA